MTPTLVPILSSYRLISLLGSWVDDRMQGKGIFCYNTGHYIEGSFTANYVDGTACVMYPGGSFTKGFFKKGLLDDRVLSYNADKDTWMLLNYKDGKLRDIFYEGTGKPVTFSKFYKENQTLILLLDSSVNTINRDYTSGAVYKTDNNYAIHVLFYNLFLVTKP